MCRDDLFDLDHRDHETAAILARIEIFGQLLADRASPTRTLVAQ